MRRPLATAATAALAALAIAAPGARALPETPENYDFKSVEASVSTAQAAAHPDFSARYDLALDPASEFGQIPYAATREMRVDLPAGMVGNPTAVPRCSMQAFASGNTFTGFLCPQDAQVGIVTLKDILTYGFVPATTPLYNLVPPPGSSPARLGFYVGSIPIVIEANVRSETDYGATATAVSSSETSPSFVETTIWGVPAHPSHDKERITPEPAEWFCVGKVGPGECPTRDSGIAEVPFMTNPTSCGPGEVSFTSNSFEIPDVFVSAAAPLPDTAGCESVPFDPSFSLKPTTRAAASPAGVDVRLAIPQDGLTKADGGLASAHLRKAVVTLPEGVSLNPAAARGLGACAPEQVGLTSSDPVRFDARPADCPDSSKVGAATIDTPLLDEPLRGSLYIAAQEDNPFDALLAGYLVAEGAGVVLKQAGRFDLDPADGRITAVFDAAPQQPFESVELHFFGGERGPISTPSSCGTYATDYELTPWSGNPPVAGTSSFTIDRGCDTGGFAPGFAAGAANPLAGAHTAFIADIARKDGEQNLAGVRIALPEGLLAKLAGVPLCPEAAAPTGACPPGSRIGRVQAAVGAGPSPLWVPEAGREPTAIYLAGPYRAAPYSVVVKAPAQAGPFDLGTVAVRTALHVDRATAAVSAVSDPLPQILRGVPIAYRHLRVAVDRPGFMLNPTDCSEQAVGARIASDQGAVAARASRFQLGGCGDLGFSPRISLRLFGPTERGANPRLRAVVRAREGDANIGRAAVTLPRSEFLDQAHIRTICTRVQFAAEACPKGSVYGSAVARTPLLDQPLRGPVYLRSSDHELPDLVAVLKGQVEIELVGRIDSVRGGIRTTFESPPDAPVSSFVLTMQKGRKSLLVNSRDVCQRRWRAVARLRGQNGARQTLRPVLRNKRCAKAGRGR